MRFSQTVLAARCGILFFYGSLFAGGALGAADLSGDWEVAGKYLGDVNYARMSLKIEGDKLTGSMNEIKLEGTVKGDEFSFTGKRPNGKPFGDFKGTAKGGNLEGTAVWFGDLEVN